MRSRIIHRFNRLDQWSKKRVTICTLGLFSSSSILVAYGAGLANAIELTGIPIAIAGFELGHFGADLTRRILKNLL